MDYISTALNISPAEARALRDAAEKAGNRADDLGGVGSRGKSVTTQSGDTLVYQSNGKHVPGQHGYNTRAGTEPNNAADIFAQSTQVGDARYAQDANGNIHRFFNDGNGTWHWSGSTGDKSSPLKIDNKVKPKLKKLGMTGKALK